MAFPLVPPRIRCSPTFEPSLDWVEFATAAGGGSVGGCIRSFALVHPMMFGSAAIDFEASYVASPWPYKVYDAATLHSFPA